MHSPPSSSNSSATVGKASRTVSLFVVVIAGLLLLGAFIWPEPSSVSDAETLRRARLALTAGKYEEAESLTDQLTVGTDVWEEGVLVAGEAATRDKRFEDAATHYRKISSGDSEAAIVARFSLGDVLLHSGNLTEADRAFREVLKLRPSNLDAVSRLAYVLGIAGRRRESGVYLFLALKSGQATLDELILFTDLERPLDEGEFLRSSAEEYPDDEMVLSGLAANAAAAGRADEALRILRRISENNPNTESVQCLLGELLAESDQGGFREWHAGLPDTAESWPDLWYARGLWSENTERPEMAVGCYLEAIKRAPTHRRANYRIGIVLSRLNSPHAESFSDRSRELLELSTWLSYARESQGRNENAMREIVDRLHSLARPWEACAWANASLKIFPSASWYQPVLSEYGPQLGPELPLALPLQDLTVNLREQQFPPFRPGIATGLATNEGSRQRPIRFREVADVGLEFIYNNAYDSTTPGARIQEQTGGGATVMDLDGDTWPDLYLVQGGDWIHGSESSRKTEDSHDVVFRNLRGQRWQDVTEETGVYELDFGQASAAGDINNDGFPDLYVGNIGPNSLYLNNGDGTFVPSQPPSSAAETRFTSSVAIADLDGNGTPDLFDTHYVTGEEVFELICNGRACSPSEFDGVRDELHLSDGSGGFETVVAQTPSGDSKGLGVVIAAFEPGGQPEIFVANDQTPNFVLSLEERDSKVLSDSGLVRGLAYSQNGLVTAAMGVAADDVNNDGLIDLFVTNFEDESNCLYVQTSPGYFADVTRVAGLKSPSYSFVGWGTQFIDPDRNGELDLVLTNGHVDSYVDDEKDAAMRSQFFRNVGSTKFEEQNADEVGEFFSRPLFGRALVKLDWNRDNLVDFLVVPIRSQVALVVNQSPEAGHFISVRLHATRSARDATFALVEVETADSSWKKQLIAGHGYHATNENFLQFGLDERDVINRVTVTWPSGATTIIDTPQVDSTLQIVEGQNTVSQWINDSGSTIPATCQ